MRSLVSLLLNSSDFDSVHSASKQYENKALIPKLIGKTTASTASLTQGHTSQLSKSALPNSTLRVSNAESAFQYSRPSNPYLVLSSSQPESMVFDAESPFSNSDIMATWMPPIFTSTPTPLGDGVLDLHMFTFSPSQTCYDTSYRSELTTTNPEGVPSGNGWFLEGGQPSGGNEYTAFDS